MTLTTGTELHDQLHSSNFSDQISQDAIEKYGTRDRALVMTILQELEISDINEINYTYNLFDKAVSPQAFIDYSHERQLKIENFGEQLKSIGILAGWFLPHKYDRWGMKIVNIHKVRKIVYSLIKEGYIQILKHHKPYRYITTTTFNNYFSDIS